MFCPICRKAPPAQGWKPFCSERCKQIDLGNWLSGGYRISRPASEEELDEGMRSSVPDDTEPSDD